MILHVSYSGTHKKVSMIIYILITSIYSALIRTSTVQLTSVNLPEIGTNSSDMRFVSRDQVR